MSPPLVLLRPFVPAKLTLTVPFLSSKAAEEVRVEVPAEDLISPLFNVTTPAVEVWLKPAMSSVEPPLIFKAPELKTSLAPKTSFPSNTVVEPVQPLAAAVKVKVPVPDLDSEPDPRVSPPVMVVFPEPSTASDSLATLVTLPVVNCIPLATLKIEVLPALSRDTAPTTRVGVAEESKFPPLLTTKLVAPIFRVPKVWVTEAVVEGVPAPIVIAPLVVTSTLLPRVNALSLLISRLPPVRVTLPVPKALLDLISRVPAAILTVPESPELLPERVTVELEVLLRPAVPAKLTPTVPFRSSKAAEEVRVEVVVEDLISPSVNVTTPAG